MAETLVVLVSGRGALAKLAGVPSVLRHVQAGRTLGLDVVVVFPPERGALGAEIRGVVEDEVACLSADRFADLVAPPSEPTLVVAAEWYLSLAAIVAVRDQDTPRVFGRVVERGCTSIPVARVTRDEAAAVALRLGAGSAAASLAALPAAGASTVDLDPRSEQRLSDNVSTAHAEEKLVETLFGPQRVLPVLRVRPTLAPPLARMFNETALGPAGISAMKLFLGLAAAWILEGGSYANGLVGAVLYFVARLIGASGVVLARASLAENDLREKLDLAGDTVLHLALLWAVAGGPARGHGAAALAGIATAGVMISTGIAYVFVMKEAWEARRRAISAAERHGHEARVHAPMPTASDEFVSRFVQRDGIAYALLFAAFAGRLDLFLWAAAVASHLFYVLWLLTRPRRDTPTMAMGRAA